MVSAAPFMIIRESSAKTRIYAVIFLGVFAAYILASLSLGALTALPELGDGQDYDSIAFNIWQGRGFGHNWDDPEWRRPYLASPIYKDVLNRHSEFYPTTYRPPAMPYLLALVYKLAGRNFASWRIVNCAIMAAAVTIAAAISARFAGPMAAIITASLALLSPQLTASSHRFLTEALATFLRYGYVRSPRSIYRGIYKLPPGTLLKISDRNGNTVPQLYDALGRYIFVSGTAHF